MSRAGLLVAAAAFVAMAALQLNDPDPLYWVVVYGATAWVVAARALRPACRTLTAIVIGLAAAGALIAAPGFVDYLESGDFASIGGDMADGSYVEPAREFLGLMIALTALFHVMRRGRSRG